MALRACRYLCSGPSGSFLHTKLQQCSKATFNRELHAASAAGGNCILLSTATHSVKLRKCSCLKMHQPPKLSCGVITCHSEAASMPVIAPCCVIHAGVLPVEISVVRFIFLQECQCALTFLLTFPLTTGHLHADDLLQ